jgi:hypothetical protein
MVHLKEDCCTYSYAIIGLHANAISGYCRLFYFCEDIINTAIYCLNFWKELHNFSSYICCTRM